MSEPLRWAEIVPVFGAALNVSSASLVCSNCHSSTHDDLECPQPKRCYICFDTEHAAWQCLNNPAPQSELYRAAAKCTICGDKGHVHNRCKAEGGPLRGKPGTQQEKESLISKPLVIHTADRGSSPKVAAPTLEGRWGQKLLSMQQSRQSKTDTAVDDGQQLEEIRLSQADFHVVIGGKIDRYRRHHQNQPTGEAAEVLEGPARPRWLPYRSVGGALKEPEVQIESFPYPPLREQERRKKLHHHKQKAKKMDFHDSKTTDTLPLSKVNILSAVMQAHTGSKDDAEKHLNKMYGQRRKQLSCDKPFVPQAASHSSRDSITREYMRAWSARSSQDSSSNHADSFTGARFLSKAKNTKTSVSTWRNPDVSTGEEALDLEMPEIPIYHETFLTSDGAEARATVSPTKQHTPTPASPLKPKPPPVPAIKNWNLHKILNIDSAVTPSSAKQVSRRWHSRFKSTVAREQSALTQRLAERQSFRARAVASPSQLSALCERALHKGRLWHIAHGVDTSDKSRVRGVWTEACREIAENCAAQKLRQVVYEQLVEFLQQIKAPKSKEGHKFVNAFRLALLKSDTDPSEPLVHMVVRSMYAEKQLPNLETSKIISFLEFTLRMHTSEGVDS